MPETRFTLKDYKLRLGLEIMLFLVRFKPPNKRIRAMKIDFLTLSKSMELTH